MKPVFLWIFWGVACPAVFGQWQEFRSLEGKFRILVPGELTHRVDSLSTPLGSLAFHTFFFQPERQDAENLFYGISYCDYPPNSIHSDSTALLEEFFQATMEEAAESVGGDLIYSAPETLDGYPGRVWRVEYGEGKVAVRSRAFLVGRRFYLLRCVAFRERALNPSAERFFDSFRLF